jgi:nucleoid-associated protein YgaU
MDLDFLKEVGESLKGTNIDSADEFEKALVARVKALRLRVTDLDIQYDKGVATVMGMVTDQATKEKVLLTVGNVKGVAKVKDSLVVGMSSKEQVELRKAAAARAGMASGQAKVAAQKAAEKARKEAKAKFDLEMRRAAFKKELNARKKAADAVGTMHTVKKGESLTKIAKKYYGDGSKWKVIFEANQPMIKKADLIYIGQVIRIPKA